MVREGRFQLNVMEPNIPRALKDIVEVATHTDPMERYPNARSLAFDLRREMHRLGLCDAQTCVRHAVVGWCEVRRGSEPDLDRYRKSDLVPKLDDDTAAETRRAKKKNA